MSAGRVTLRVEGQVAYVLFERPEARNAMTWRMYEDLAAACDTMRAIPNLRCAVFRGAGGKAFVAGTDIAQFADFDGSADGLRYEADMEAHLAKLESLPFPTMAVVEGWAIGGGLAIASLCDLRIATPDSRFGLPIARTLGNCLSIRNLARLQALIGPARLKRMIMLAEPLSATEMLECGYLCDIVQREALEEKTIQLTTTVLSNAPLTLRATKEALHRLHPNPVGDSDLIELCYGSRDFKHGVSAFIAKASPQWTGE